jgi:hypothetical protein
MPGAAGGRSQVGSMTRGEETAAGGTSPRGEGACPSLARIELRFSKREALVSEAAPRRTESRPDTQ